jgi:hypothetical protein
MEESGYPETLLITNDTDGTSQNILPTISLRRSFEMTGLAIP